MAVDPADVPTWLLAALAAQWQDSEGDWLPEAPRIALMAGQTPTADWCSGDGCWTVYGRLDSAYPSSNGITQDAVPNGLLSPLVHRWHLGTFMCIAGMDESGNPPSAEAQSADTAAILDTMEKLRCAADQLIVEHFTRKTALMGAWYPTGPTGDCAGGYWPLSLSLREDHAAPPAQSGIARRGG